MVDHRNPHRYQLPASTNQDQAVAGHFYVNKTGLAAYDLTGGAILMQFTAGSFGENPPVPDGQGGAFLQETWELTIVQATGMYSQYVGGHNHMVDRFHVLASGMADESCFCIISTPSSPGLWWTSN